MTADKNEIAKTMRKNVLHSIEDGESEEVGGLQYVRRVKQTMLTLLRAGMNSDDVVLYCHMQTELNISTLKKYRKELYSRENNRKEIELLNKQARAILNQTEEDAENPWNPDLLTAPDEGENHGQ